MFRRWRQSGFLRPLHGWRAFLGEVGIVVLGVLIALGAGQLAENWNRRSEARKAEAAIDAELGLVAGVLKVRELTAPCRDMQIAQIRTILARARSSGQLPDVQKVKRGSSSPIVTTAWDSTASDGTASDIPEQRRRDYAIVYNQIGMFRTASAEENRLLTHARLLQDSPGRISDALVAGIATSVAELEAHTRLNNIIATQALVSIRDLGISPDYGYFTGGPGRLGKGTLADVRRELINNGAVPPHCMQLTADGVSVPAALP